MVSEVPLTVTHSDDRIDAGGKALFCPDIRLIIPERWMNDFDRPQIKSEAKPRIMKVRSSGPRHRPVMGSAIEFRDCNVGRYGYRSVLPIKFTVSLSPTAEVIVDSV